MKTKKKVSAASMMMARIGRSITRRPEKADSAAKQGKFLAGTLVFHFRPRRVPHEAARFTHTWGLGGISLVLVCSFSAQECC